MKAVFFVLLALPLVFAGTEFEQAQLRATLAGAGDSNMVMDLNMINEINSNPSSTWTAGVNEKFAQMTVAQAKALMGTPMDMSKEMKTAVLPEGDLPEEFDARDAWPKCINAIRNQGQCGSCWAFGSSEALSDRVCIATGEKIVLSPQFQVSCDKMNMACRGGNLQYAWNFLAQHGTVSDDCMPYTSGAAGEVPSCPKSCHDSTEPFKLYKAKNVVQPKDEASIMAEIKKNGPVEGGFIVYQDFMAYKSGVYKHTTGQQMGGHAIKIMGWGVENGTKYWLVANSWGTSWGIDGTFKIARGTNEVMIESNVIAGEYAA